MKNPIRGLTVNAWRLGLMLSGLLCLLPLAVDASEVRTTVSPGDAQAMADLPSDAAELGMRRDGDKIELKLEDAVALTLQRNLSLVVERYRRSQSVLGIQEAMGVFDLNIGLAGGLSEDTSPTTSTLQQTDENSITDENAFLNFDLSQLTAFGGTASLGFDNGRAESSNLRTQPNPQFGVNFDLSFTQPLLRNFGREVTYNPILVARNNSAISREVFQAEVETIVQQVSDRYWVLVEAMEQLKVTQESLALAKELHEMNRIQVEVGTMAPLEMVSSEAGVATREEEIIRRQADVEDSADILRRLLNLDQAQYWDLEIVPVTDPITNYIKIDFDEAYKTAIEKRTDVERQRLGNSNRELQARFAKNQKKPSLDLTISYGLNAVDGDVVALDPDTEEPFTISRDYFDALDQLIEAESDGWSVQAVLAYPLQNRTAKARLAQADLDVEQGELEMSDLEQQVLLDVRSLSRAVRTAEQQIESAKVSTKLQRRNLDAEQKRYENGLATSFEVLQIQEVLTEALSREVSAITNYRRALNAFYLATGEILDEVGVELLGD